MAVREERCQEGGERRGEGTPASLPSGPSEMDDPGPQGVGGSGGNRAASHLSDGLQPDLFLMDSDERGKGPPL